MDLCHAATALSNPRAGVGRLMSWDDCVLALVELERHARHLAESDDSAANMFRLELQRRGLKPKGKSMSKTFTPHQVDLAFAVISSLRELQSALPKVIEKINYAEALAIVPGIDNYSDALNLCRQTCPHFCRSPEHCAGLGCCPREIACDH